MGKNWRRHTEMKFTYTRTFRVHHSKGEFKIFVTRTDLKGFYAGSILYYEKERASAQVTLSFDLQTFVNDSEENVLNECKEWVNQHLGKDYRIEEIYE